MVSSEHGISIDSVDISVEEPNAGSLGSSESVSAGEDTNSISPRSLSEISEDVSPSTGASEIASDYRVAENPGVGNIDQQRTETTAIVQYYPPNAGFAQEPEEVQLSEGDIISRVGSPNGNYFAPKGTPMWERSLPPGLENNSEHLFQVMKPFTVYSGPTAAWFGQPGGGTQYLSILNQNYLEQNGYIRNVQ